MAAMTRDELDTHLRDVGTVIGGPAVILQLLSELSRLPREEHRHFLRLLADAGSGTGATALLTAAVAGLAGMLSALELPVSDRHN